MNKDCFWWEFRGDKDSMIAIERGVEWVNNVSIEDLYQAFKSRLMTELKADRQGDLYERPEGDDE